MKFIYCDNCKVIKPLVRDLMLTGGHSTHDAEDLICGDCHYVIATLHESDSPILELKV